MGSYPWWHRALDWLAFLPVVIGFRLIILTGNLGNRAAQDVLRAMWKAGLNVPERYAPCSCTKCRRAAA